MQPLPITALALFAALLPAQTFVVDAANGPGAQFTSLAAAIPAVPDGSTLIVRTGAYDGNLTIVGKGLTILGQPGARFSSSTNSILTVQGLGATQTVVIRGFTADLPLVFGTFGLLCQQNQGLVVLEAIVPNNNLYGSLLLGVDSCAAVLVRDSIFRGSVALTDSVVTFERCTMRSGAGTGNHFAQVRGAVQLVDSTVAGPYASTAITGAACTLTQGDLRVLGTSRLEGGFSGIGTAGYAIAGTGTVRLSPQTVLTGHTPAIESTVNATTLAMPTTSVLSAPIGAPVTASLLGPVGGIGALAVGFPGPATFAPGLADPFCWAPGSVVTVAVGATGPSTPLAYTAVLPAPPAWTGLALVWQGVSLDPAGGLQASNPGVSIAY